MAKLNGLIAAIGIAAIIPMAHFFGVKGAVAQIVVVAAAHAWLSGRFLRPLTSIETVNEPCHVR